MSSRNHGELSALTRAHRLADPRSAVRAGVVPEFQAEAFKPKLDRTLSIALVTLFVIAIGLPLYWILEPARQAGATQTSRAEMF